MLSQLSGYYVFEKLEKMKIFKKIDTQPIPEEVPNFPWKVLFMLFITVLTICINIFIFYYSMDHREAGQQDNNKDKTYTVQHSQK